MTAWHARRYHCTAHDVMPYINAAALAAAVCSLFTYPGTADTAPLGPRAFGPHDNGVLTLSLEATVGAPMKGNSPPEVLNLVPRHPCTYPKHPNRFIQPYAPHCISMPLGGVRLASKKSEPRAGA